MSRMLAAFALLAAGLAASADDPPPNPDKDSKDVDVSKTAERIIQDAKDASKRLADKDSGAMTQQIQRNVIQSIDELLRKAKEPPPPGSSGGGGGSSSGNSGMGGSSKQQPSSSSSSSAAQRKERREKRNEIAKGSGKDSQSDLLPAPSNSTNGLRSGSPSPNKIDPKMTGSPPRIPDAYRDVWGQLPEKLRQEMDLYFREDFMPRYGDLLRQYYSSLAERDGKNKR